MQTQTEMLAKPPKGQHAYLVKYHNKKYALFSTLSEAEDIHSALLAREFKNRNPTTSAERLEIYNTAVIRRIIIYDTSELTVIPTASLVATQTPAVPQVPKCTFCSKPAAITYRIYTYNNEEMPLCIKCVLKRNKLIRYAERLAARGELQKLVLDNPES